MALDKAGLTSALTAVFDDTSGKDAATKAAEIADAIDVYVKTAVAAVSIPAGTVVTVVSGGSGAPAVGVLNPAPIGLTGDPAGVPPGGLS